MSKVLQLREDLRKMDTGYGLMSLTWKAEPVPEEQAFQCMHNVVDKARKYGYKAFFNAGEFYGADCINLRYIKDFFTKFPELRSHVLVSCKGAIDAATLQPRGTRDQVVESVTNCANELGGYIDMFEVARIDMGIRTEGEVYPYESFEALAEMVENGIIGGISLSEVNEAQIRKIHADWGKYLTCVEVELSLFSTQILQDGVAKACSDLGLVVICYSPLGRGLLTGAIKELDDLPAGDFRRMLKRFHGDSLKQNLVLTKFLQDEIVAKRDAAHAITLPQLALGWIKHWNGQKEYSGAKFIPIPSGTTQDKINENFDKDKATITDAEFEKINDFLVHFETQGDRYETV